MQQPGSKQRQRPQMFPDARASPQAPASPLFPRAPISQLLPAIATARPSLDQFELAHAEYRWIHNREIGRRTKGLVIRADRRLPESAKNAPAS